MRFYLMTTAIAVAGVSFVSPAQADCAPDMPMDGDLVTCLASDTDGFSTEAGMLDIFVADDADVTTIGKGIVATGADTLMVNAGTIDSEDDAVTGGDGFALNNEGTIVSDKVGFVGETSDGDAATGVLIGLIDGASISGDDGILSGDDLTVTNAGLIEAEDDGIETETADGAGENLVVENDATGMIKAGGDAIKGGDFMILLNEGTIYGGDEAVQADGAEDALVTNFGTITAFDKAITFDDGVGSVLINHGDIISETDEGFETGDAAVVTNSGSILAAEDAVQVGQNAFIENTGFIRAVGTDDEGDGIDMDSGTVENGKDAEITAVDGSGIDFDESTIESLIINHGLISGLIGIQVETDPAEANTAAQIIENHGIIEGLGGMAMVLGAGEDKLTMFSGAGLMGGIDMGTDNDMLVFNGDFSGEIAGGMILDGAAGDDMVKFTDYAFDDITAVNVTGELFDLSLDNGMGAFSLSLNSWDFFMFGDETYAASEIAGLAAVPLPAGIVLLGGGLAGLGALRRRAARIAA